MQQETMQILFLAHRLPYPPNKGDKIRSFWELRKLSERHDVDLFCFYDDPADAPHIQTVQRYCRFCYVERLSPIRSRAQALLATATGKPFSIAYYFSSRMARRVAQAVRSRVYDLIFAFSSSMAQYAQPWSNIERIVDLVDVDSDKWEQYARRSDPFRARIWKREAKSLSTYEAELVRSFTNTLVCTEPEARLLRTIAPAGKISVLQNWLDLDYYDPAAIIASDEIHTLKPYILFSGSMDYFPNVDAVQFFCEKVLPTIKSGSPNLRFVIAGRNPMQNVRRLAQRLGVEVTGTVADIRPYLKEAAAAVAPLRIARGVQNKVLEALAMDTPAIVSSAVAAALPPELRSVVFAADEPAQIAKSVLKTIKNSRRAGTLRQSVVQYVNKQNLHAQLESLVCDAAKKQSLTSSQVERPTSNTAWAAM